MFNTYWKQTIHISSCIWYNHHHSRFNVCFFGFSRVRRSPWSQFSSRHGSVHHLHTTWHASSTHCIQVFLLLPLHLWQSTDKSEIEVYNLFTLLWHCDIINNAVYVYWYSMYIGTRLVASRLQSYWIYTTMNCTFKDIEWSRKQTELFGPHVLALMIYNPSVLTINI